MASKSGLEGQFIGYEVPDYGEANPYSKPDLFWARSNSGGFESVLGRRKSQLLCVDRIRAQVDAWREGGYPGASETTKKLFWYWFEEERADTMFGVYRPYFIQREAIETLVYLIEIQGAPDAWNLIEEFGVWETSDLMKDTFSLQTTMDGYPQLQIPTQLHPIPLPPRGIPRYAVKAATGSGKTIVMAHIVAWSYFHAQRESQSPQANNFLILAPNVIVFERLSRDFVGGKIFGQLKIAPPSWKLNLQVILRGDSTEPVGKNTLVLTNVQQLYERAEWKPKNPLDKILGRAPIQGKKQERPILDRVESMNRLMVINDEAHHLHRDDLKWNSILLELHDKRPLVSWLDFSATPKLQNGTVFPWVVTDYPLAQAVEHGIVKIPVVIKGIESADPEGVNADNAVEKYGTWIAAGVERLRVHEQLRNGVHGSSKPVMFVMCESVKHAESVGNWLTDPKSGYGFKENEVLVIHTKGDSDANVKDADLKILRDQANTIDSEKSSIRVVVSVLILREGWDVKNVTVVLGLRPGNAKSEILPEQAVGRGLRLMQDAFGYQVLEVLGTPAFQSLVSGLEDEGVLIGEAKVDPARVPRMISPEASRVAYDIHIPRTSATFVHVYKNIAALTPDSIEPAFTADDLAAGAKKVQISFESMMEKVRLGEAQLSPGSRPLTMDSLALVTTSAINGAGMTNLFHELFPIVREYVEKFCFGVEVDRDSNEVRDFMSDAVNRQQIVRVLEKKIKDLTTKRQEVRIEGKPLKLSSVKAFRWNREVLNCTKTIFNFVPTWNNFESDFAAFLDRVEDVQAFSALAESNTEFFVNYQKPNGALARYFPDWVVRREVDPSLEHWIIETKGREWDGTHEKDTAVHYWCEQVSKDGGTPWRYCRINQKWFDSHQFMTFAEMILGLKASVGEDGRGEAGVLF